MSPLPCVLLAAALGAPADVPPDTMAACRAAAARAGNSADAHVRLANWCESQGLAAEREAHLAEALRASPNRPQAHARRARCGWGRAGSAPTTSRSHPSRPNRPRRGEKYDKKLSDLEPTAGAQDALGAWCASNGLAAESSAHGLDALRIDPDDAEAHRRLRHKQQNGRWIDAAVDLATRPADRRAVESGGSSE